MFALCSTTVTTVQKVHAQYKNIMRFVLSKLLIYKC